MTPTMKKEQNEGNLRTLEKEDGTSVLRSRALTQLIRDGHIVNFVEEYSIIYCGLCVWYRRLEITV